jgi:oxygen-independent coproporphyrinogen-3 oxidase
VNSAEIPTLGVYLSVPFCRAKCSFCNFASGVGSGGAMEQYVAALCAEIEGAPAMAMRLGADLPHTVDSIYFGGGTPSLLSPHQIERVFAALRAVFDVQENAEVTLEAAPGQIAEDVLAAALRLGVNRVSMGVQSFIDRECAAVGRLHTGRECVREIVRLRSAGVAEVGADLIAGLPYQTMASLTHLSIYMLEVDEDSRLGAEVLSGGARFHAPGVPSDELSAAMYEAACAWLPQHGFAQYEISNFAAIEGGVCHRSCHNMKYWKRAPYIGFGLDAHSMLRCDRSAVRFANADEIAAYRAADAGRDARRVSAREAFDEAIFLGLRMNEGIAVEALRSAFAREWVTAFEASARDLTAEGFMLQEDGCWRLTPRGRLVSNEVFGNLLEMVAA